MAISTVPVKEAILNDLQGIDSNGDPTAPVTGLALLNAAGVAADDYYTVVEKITRIEEGPMDLKVFPTIVIAPISTEYDPEGAGAGTTTIAATYIIQLALVMRTRDGALKKIEQFIRDAHKAVLVDRQRNGNAISTRALTDEVFYPTDDDGYCTANLVLSVEYRTRWDDLNSPT